ncbi:MAG: cupin domain-containing protein [Candidatus Promineifilaceae bacterium]
MKGKFIQRDDVKVEELDWGTLGWAVFPGNAGSTQLTFIEVKIEPGKGHAFHKHPDQEELISVRDGQIEQWLEDKKMILSPGESVFIPKDMVHASFNVSDKPVNLFVVLGPCVGETGYEMVPMDQEEPWKSLR